MMQNEAMNDKSFSDSSIDRLKDFDNRLNLIETTLKVGRKDPKLGFLHGTFNIDEFPQAKNCKLVSNRIEFAGAAWHLAVYKQKRTEKQVLGVYLRYEAGFSGISYDTDYTIRLLGSAENIEDKFKRCFAGGNYGYGHPDLVDWTRLTNFTNGFVDEKGNFEVQVVFSVMGKTNTDVFLDAQFLTSGFVKSDCIVLVENRRFSVNKGFLSSFSSYFQTLFFGDFREKNQEEVELKNVCAAEFLHLLEAIYPPVDIEAGNEDVIRKNVECLLRLADCYQVDIVIKRCEVYLKNCPIDEVALEDKILYAQDYRLPELLDHCIKAFKTVDDVKKLRHTSHYSRLTKENQLLIHENIT